MSAHHRNGFPTLKPVPRAKDRKRAKDGKGRFVPQEVVDGKDARIPALLRRAEAFGVDQARDVGAQLRVMAEPHMGDPLGMVLQRMCARPEDVERLWRVWTGLHRATKTYKVRVLDSHEGPQGAKLTTDASLPADPDAKRDLREAWEKDLGAEQNYRRWQGYLAQLESANQVRILDRILGGEGDLWQDHSPTIHGEVAFQILCQLADVVDGGSR